MVGIPVAIDRMTEFSINVGPRDTDRLRRRCEEWLKTIKEAHLAVERIAAATALGHVADPVAVPSLEAAAARDSCGSCFYTLVKIGTPDSIAALRRLADSPQQYVRAQARGALATFARWLVAPRHER
jgi:HEAT repeat protein